MKARFIENFIRIALDLGDNAFGFCRDFPSQAITSTPLVSPILLIHYLSKACNFHLLLLFFIISSFINEIRHSLASERLELISSNKPSFSYERILSDISGRIFRIAFFSGVLVATARYRIAISYLY